MALFKPLTPVTIASHVRGLATTTTPTAPCASTSVYSFGQSGSNDGYWLAFLHLARLSGMPRHTL
jgi:hypothetical protein